MSEKKRDRGEVAATGKKPVTINRAQADKDEPITGPHRLRKGGGIDTGMVDLFIQAATEKVDGPAAKPVKSRRVTPERTDAEVDLLIQAAAEKAGTSVAKSSKPNKVVLERTGAEVDPVKRAEQLQKSWRSDSAGGGSKVVSALHNGVAHSRPANEVPFSQRRHKAHAVVTDDRLAAAQALLSGDRALAGRPQRKAAAWSALERGNSAATVSNKPSPKGDKRVDGKSRASTVSIKPSVQHQVAGGAVVGATDSVEVEALASGVMRLVCGSISGVSSVAKYAVLGVRYGLTDSAGLIRKTAGKLCPRSGG